MSRTVFLACVLAATLAICITSVAQNNGLVAAYSFDEGAGTTVQDSSGNGNTGSVNNATWSSAGRFGSALSFNGTSSWVVINNSTSLTLTTGMTLEAWVNPSVTSSSWRDVVYKAVDIYFLEATSSSGGVPGAGATGKGNVLGTAVLPVNTWSHLAATYDGTNLRLYVNGTLVGTKAATGALSTSTSALYIGGDAKYGQYFKGLIDEVRIYNIALSQAQIQTDMTTPITSSGGTDTTPPTQPTNLAATAISSSQINLTWTASTDNVGVTGYYIERCAGTSCTNFAQIATSSTTSYSDTGLTASTTYNYRVRATDAAGNLSGFSNTASATTQSSGGGGGGTTGLVAAYAFNEGSGTTVTDASGNGNTGTISNATWTTSGKYGNALVFNGTNSWVQIASSASLNLTTAMTLEAWVNPAVVKSAWTDIIYKPVDMYYLEATSTSGGKPAAGATGKTTVFGTAALPTSTWSHLAVTYDGANFRLYVNGALVNTVANTGALSISTNPLFIGGDNKYGQYFNGMIDDVRIYNVALSQSQIQTDMTTPVSGSGGTDTTPPTQPTNLAATAISSSQINLAWTASTDNVGVTGYYIERCAGTSCTNFAQIATSSTTSYSDNGLTASTTYNYRVRATDAAGNLSGYSNTASATTQASGGGGGGTTGLVAAYAFNEGSGTTVTDASGNGNTGTISNATWTTSGKYGNALVFNGTNSWVQIASSASLNLTTAMTLEAWVNPAVVKSAWTDIIYKPVDMYYLEATSTSSGKPAAGATGKTTAFGTAALPTSTWSHLAVTYDGANFRLYVNGALVNTVPNTGALSTSTNPLFIGGDNKYGQYFNGMIDDVRIYNVALSQSQIQTDMTTPVSVSGGGGGGGLTISPRQVAITSLQTQQFSASQSGVTWLVDGTAGGSTSTGTISPTGLYSPPATAGSHVIQAQLSAQSASATVYITNYGGTFTYHNDTLRTGANLNETVLSPANVTTSTFGKLYTFSVDGQVYTEPLYVPNVTVAGKGAFNVVYVGTEHDSVYAFDADGSTTTPLWKKSFINGTTVIPVPAADTGETSDITNEIGITGTPVIDASTGTLYVVTATKETSGSTVTYVQRLHALDITSGAEKFGGPVVITASVSGTGVGGNGTTVPFNSLHQNQRAALLLLNGVVYLAFASHGDIAPWHGWILGYNATSLSQGPVLNLTPNGCCAGVWHAGGGLVADANNYIYSMAGNGDFSTSLNNWGNSFLKLTTSLTIADWFVPFNTATLTSNDFDVGSGGPIALPDQPGSHPHLLVGAGKEGRIYLLDRDNMGHFNSTSDQIVQEIPNALGTNNTAGTGNYGPPSYWNGYVYFGSYPDHIKAFKMSNGLLSTTPTSQSSETFGNRGTRPTVSANGTANAIVWAVEKTSDTTPGVLHAYDANNLATELWTSNQAGTRDQMDVGMKFAVPTVANGKVFVGTFSTVTVYGLLP